MIIVIFGQPNCGKSTLANEIIKQTSTYVNIDGDKLRELFVNKDYSKEGRMKNLNRASDIAHFLNSTGTNVILSLVYPYKEVRDYLNNLTKDVKWVYLSYDEPRGREGFHVADFETPDKDEKVLSINTDRFTIKQCVNLIKDYV